jgi:hypothetical protein
VTAELVVGIPIRSDGVDVQRRLFEVEAVRDPCRYDDAGRLTVVDLYGHREAFGGRAGPKIAEADDTAPADDDQVVVVDDVNVRAAQRSRLRVHRVPLNRFDRKVPAPTKELDQRPALIGVQLQRAQLDAGREPRIVPHARIIAPISECR